MCNIRCENGKSVRARAKHEVPLVGIFCLCFTTQNFHFFLFHIFSSIAMLIQKFGVEKVSRLVDEIVSSPSVSRVKIFQ